MNERIKELAVSTGIYDCLTDPYDALENGDTHSSILLDLERFALLIVEECVGVADDYVKDCTCDEHINCKHPQSAIGRKIKQHFGVEE